MIDVDITLVIQAINFLIMWMVLNIILFNPIRGIIKKRAEYMQTQLSAVESFSEQAVSKVAAYEEALADARKAGVEDRTRLKDEGLAHEAEVVGEAGKQAAAKVAEARAAVRADFDATLKELKAKVPALAEKAANQVLS